MVKVIIERSGRCLGGDNNIQATLLQKRIRGPYQITVKTGVHNYSKKIDGLEFNKLYFGYGKREIL